MSTRRSPGRTDRLGIYYGFKTMNSHIHMLEALAELSRVDAVRSSRNGCARSSCWFATRSPSSPGALNLYLTRDWRAIPAHDSFGHDIETAYLLVEAADALGMPEDERTWKVARSLVDHALDWGWDEDRGGFYDKGESFAGNAFDTTKVWWTEAEGLNALMVMHRKYGKETDRYLQGVSQAVGLHSYPHARPEIRRLVRRDRARRHPPRRRRQGQPLDGQLPYLQGDDERGRGCWRSSSRTASRQ